MTRTELLATKQDAFIIKSLKEAERRRLNRAQTLRYVGLPAEVIAEAVQRTVAAIPSLPAESPSEAAAQPQDGQPEPVAAAAAEADLPEAPAPEDVAEAAAAPAPAADPAAPPADPGAGMREEPVAGAPATPSPQAEARRQVASKGREKLKSAREARAGGTGEGPMAPKAPEPRRPHPAKGHKVKATRQQIHASIEARLPTLNRLLDAGCNANEIAKEMKIGTARVYQIARQAGRPFGGVAKPEKAAQETSAA